MISNITRGSFESIPFHRLETGAQTVWWIKGKQGRTLIASALHQLYPEGCGVCSDTCLLMAFINPRGGVREVPWPWPRYPIHIMANNPRAHQEAGVHQCPCFEFYDPEVEGPWRNRGINAHHPFCMYLQGSLQRAKHFIDLKTPAKRPDAWFRSLKM